jgi:hypothetical protein
LRAQIWLRGRSAFDRADVRTAAQDASIAPNLKLGILLRERAGPGLPRPPKQKTFPGTPEFMSSMEGHPESAMTHEEVREKIQALVERVAELEARAAEDAGGSRSVGFSDEKLATIASSMYRSRQLRAKQFKRSLLSDAYLSFTNPLFHGDRFTDKIASARSRDGFRITVPMWLAVYGRAGLTHGERRVSRTGLDAPTHSTIVHTTRRAIV